MVLTFAAVVAPAHAALTGTLEICKSSANGMSGRAFGYSVNGGAPVTVKGGRCSGPIAAAAGSVAVTELPSSPATDVGSVSVRPSARALGVSGRTATVTVVAGSTTSNETLVTFTNVPAGGTMGDLKICKFSATPGFLGRSYTFHVNGGPGISAEANDPSSPPEAWSCRLAGSFPVGSLVTISEDVPAGQEVAWIDADPSQQLANFDTHAGSALYTIGPGMTVALFDNEPLPPADFGTGYLEVCKDAARLADGRPDPTVLGQPFDFTVETPSDTQTATVLGGQCSGPLNVLAGPVTVTEQPSPGYQLDEVFTIPGGRLLGTTQVEVPASTSTNDETQVHFVNEHVRGQLKVCKTLAAGSPLGVLNPFRFDVLDIGSGTEARRVEVTGVAGTTQCVIAGSFPTGDTVVVTEDLPPSAFTAASGPGCAPDVAGNLVCSTTIAPGINTVMVTNTAQGQLEICKKVSDRLEDPESGHLFVFRIDGAQLRIRPGTCSPPQLVSVGAHTVVESSEANYELDPNSAGRGIAVIPSGAEASRNASTRTVTVNVPWAGDPAQPGGEVVVSYTNRIKRALFKVCKLVAPGSTDVLGPLGFDFQLTTTDPAHPGPYFIRGLMMNECSLFRDDFGNVSIPVINAAGQNNFAEILELMDAQNPGLFTVSKITFQGAIASQSFCFPGTPPTCLPVADLFPGPTVNVVTFTNRTGS